MLQLRLNKGNAKQNTSEHDLELQSLPAFERAKKKLELYDITKDKKYLLTPEESDAILQKVKEKKEDELPTNIPRVKPNGSFELDVDNLERYLRDKIVGQDDAIKMLTNGIYQQAKAGNQNLVHIYS
jgi:ATP-dependent Clp protease ATP-binding subunit ClpA